MPSENLLQKSTKRTSVSVPFVLSCDLTSDTKKRLAVFHPLALLYINLYFLYARFCVIFIYWPLVSALIAFMVFMVSIMQTTVPGSTLLPIFTNGSANGDGER